MQANMCPCSLNDHSPTGIQDWSKLDNYYPRRAEMSIMQMQSVKLCVLVIKGKLCDRVKEEKLL